MEQFVELGADGMMSYLYLGQCDTRLERDGIERNAKWGLVLIIDPQPSGDRVDPAARTPEAMAFYARVGGDLGADIVTSDLPQPAEAFAGVTAGCPAPVLAGGPVQNDAGTLTLARESLDAGGSGLVFGRRIYQSADPEHLIRGLNGVIHGSA